MKYLLICLFTFPLFSNPLPEPTDEEAFQLAKKVLVKHAGAYSERTISRAGNKTIVFESVVALEADNAIFPKVLNEVKNYPNWALKNINVKPGGGSYYVKIQEMKPDPKDSNILHGIINVELPLFKHSFLGLFNLRPQEKPDVYTIRGNLVPDERSILISADAVLKAFPAENRPGFKWIFVRANVVLRHWLLYEAMPDKLLKRESGERVQIVLDNYSDEEHRLKTLPK